MSRKPDTQLLLVLLVFLGPVLLAMIAYYGPLDWAPRAAHGELIEPPIPLPPALATPLRIGTPTARLRNRWSFIYARTAPCNDECLAHLMRLHQVRLALPGDRRHRVQMVLLFAGSRPSLPPDGGWIASRLDDAGADTIIELLGEQNIRHGRVYIADPMGNLVINYPPEAAQKGMLEDLKRLLKLSPAAVQATSRDFHTPPTGMYLCSSRHFLAAM